MKIGDAAILNPAFWPVDKDEKAAFPKHLFDFQFKVISVLDDDRIKVVVVSHPAFRIKSSWCDYVSKYKKNELADLAGTEYIFDKVSLI